MSEVRIKYSKLTPKQETALKAMFNHKNTLYGGARGGGKSHWLREVAFRYATMIPGIRINFARRTLKDLTDNHQDEFQKLMGQIATWYDKRKRWVFPNGSYIAYIYTKDEKGSLDSLQGQECDVMLIDEAGQFTETQLAYLGTLVRSGEGEAKDIKKIAMSCNPEGRSFYYLKRLFVDRVFDASLLEYAEDYAYIPATVYDNPHISETYIASLMKLPKRLREAHLYGSWDVSFDNYFDMIDDDLHTLSLKHMHNLWKRNKYNRFDKLGIPTHFNRYRSLDYGRDEAVCQWWVVDEFGRSFMYREFRKEGLTPQIFTQHILRLTGKEKILKTFVPSDLNKRESVSNSATIIDVFRDNGLDHINVVSRARVEGWLKIAQLLYDYMIVFLAESDTFKHLTLIRMDEDNPNDCATEPHIITHTCDSARYYCMGTVEKSERATYDPLTGSILMNSNEIEKIKSKSNNAFDQMSNELNKM